MRYRKIAFVGVICLWLLIPNAPGAVAHQCTETGVIEQDNFNPTLQGHYCSTEHYAAQTNCNEYTVRCDIDCQECGGTWVSGSCTYENSSSPGDAYAQNWACNSQEYGQYYRLTCTCNYPPPPPSCPESNGCASGHGGTSWSTTNCGGYYDEGPDECECCNVWVSPIVVSLRGNGISLSNSEQGVLFDFWGNDHPVRVAWPVHPDDAFLVIDRNHNGQVDSGSELFGNAVMLQSGRRAANGYELLDELDENQDGSVDGRDPMFSQILVWRDVIRNGAVDQGELIAAHAVGIRAFSTSYRESARTDEWGNAFRYVGRVLFERAPRERFSVDVFLTFTEAGT